MSEMACPACGGDMEQIEKTTFTGREMREYECTKCGKKEIVDCGPALWQVLHDLNEEEKK